MPTKLYFANQEKTIIFTARSKQNCYSSIINSDCQVENILIKKLSKEDYQLNITEHFKNIRFTDKLLEVIHRNQVPGFFAYYNPNSRQWRTTLPQELKTEYLSIKFRTRNKIHPELLKEGICEKHTYTGYREVINGFIKDSILFTAPNNNKCYTSVSDVDILQGSELMFNFEFYKNEQAIKEQYNEAKKFVGTSRTPVITASKLTPTDNNQIYGFHFEEIGSVKEGDIQFNDDGSIRRIEKVL